jgi:hypothetical protein
VREETEKMEDRMNQPIVSSDRPLPDRAYRYRVLYTLEPRQSVVLTNYNYASLKSTITYLRDRYQKRFTTHKQGDGTIIVWRIS